MIGSIRAFFSSPFLPAPLGQSLSYLEFPKGINAKPAYRLTLAGSEHGFSQDWGLLPFIPTSAKKAAWERLIGTRLTITKAYVETFFGEYLEARNRPC